MLAAMLARRLTAIFLNVSTIRESLPRSVLRPVRGGQGGRGNRNLKTTSGPDVDDAADKGVWMSIWVDDVDAVHRHCVAQGLEVTMPPNVREMHVHHPDGDVFRICQARE